MILIFNLKKVIEICPISFTTLDLGMKVISLFSTLLSNEIREWRNKLESGMSYKTFLESTKITFVTLPNTIYAHSQMTATGNHLPMDTKSNAIFKNSKVSSSV